MRIATVIAFASTACAPKDLDWQGPEDRLVGEWWQNVDTNREEYDGTCALLREDGRAFALVPSLQWMYQTDWAAGGPGVVVLREGELRIGAIRLLPDGEGTWFARYSGMLLGGLQARFVPGCDAFDVERIILD